MKITKLLSPWFPDEQAIRRRTFIAAGAALSIAAGASGASVGVSFVGTGDHVNNTNLTSLAAADLAGAPGYAQANWNNLGRWGDTVTLNDSSGGSSGISIAWDATGTWSQQGNPTGLTTQGTPDANLMDAYDDSNGNNPNGSNNTTNAPAVLNTSLYSNSGNNKPLIYVSGISAWLATQGTPYYDVVIYVDGDATANRISEYWLYGASGPYTAMTFGSDVTSHVFIRDPANFLSTPNYVQVPLTSSTGPGAQPGNYAVFDSLSGDSFLLRTEEFGFGGTRRCPVNGFQIVPRLTPSTGPVIASSQPAPSRVYTGKTARFTVNPGGLAPFTYQWRKNGNNLSDGGNISGSSSASLTIANAGGGDIASYSVVVANSLGSVTSSAAPLSLTSPVVGSFAEKVVTNNAFAYWRFNDPGDPSTNAPVADLIGGFNGTYAGAALNGFNSIVGPRSPVYPGFESDNSAQQSANAFGAWATVPPLNFNTNTATLCAWIFPTTLEAANTGILMSRNGTEVSGLNFAAGNQLQYVWNTNATASVSFTSPGLIVPSNQWSFVAVVITSSNAVLFLFNTNGIASLTNTLPVTTPHIPVSFNGITWIGDDQHNPGRGFIGMIDEAAIFNYALSPGEVSGLYKRALGLTAIPPLISQNPLPKAIFAGRSAKFDVSASGDAPLSYQWRRAGNNLSNGGNISGAGSSSLTVSSAAGADDADYDVVVANFAGSITSSPAHLTVAVSNSAPAAYEAALRAANPIAYWRLNETSGSFAYDYWGGNIATYTNVVLGVPGPQPTDFIGFETTNVAGQYTYDVVTIANSSATETRVSLMNNRSQFSILGWFNSPGTQAARTGLFGQNDTAEFGFHGNGDLGIWTPNGGFAFMPQSVVIPNQWYFIAGVGNGTNLFLYLFATNGIIQTNVTVATTNYGNSTFPFRIGGNGILDTGSNFFTGLIDEVAVFDRALSLGELSGLWGAALSAGALAPTVTVQPNSATLYAGRTAQFPVTVAGSTPITYQWRKDGAPISDGGNVSGTATPTLTITGVLAGNAGGYDLVAANGSGSVTSLVATLTVIAPAPGSFEAVTLSKNPAAYWRLNETSGTVAFDFWGGHNGAYQAGAIMGVAGPTNPPFSGFEATNTAVQTTVSTVSSYVTAPFSTVATNTFSFTAWLYPLGIQENWSGLLVSRGGTGGGINYNDQQMLGYTWNNNSAATYGFVSGLLIPTNQWSFVAVVISPTNAILYLINGTTVRTATNTLAHTSDVFGNNWQIGHDDNSGNNNGTRTFNGIIDEVAVYLRSLSPTDVLDVYSAGGIPLTTLNIQLLGGGVVLTWPQGTLQQADLVTGPYSNVTGATSPYTNSPALGQKFYRVLVK